MVTITIIETINDAQLIEIQDLLKELSSEIQVTPEDIKNAVCCQNTFFFALMDDKHIVGCASLCVYNSPTGKKAHVEDVVIKSSYRGHYYGKKLIESVIEYARNSLRDVDIYLTSNPSRVVANHLYQELGFERYETNCYKMMM